MKISQTVSIFGLPVKWDTAAFEEVRSVHSAEADPGPYQDKCEVPSPRGRTGRGVYKCPRTART